MIKHGDVAFTVFLFPICSFYRRLEPEVESHGCKTTQKR
jgi:hypothetical protein